MPGLRLITALTLSTVVDHHCSGSCSAQPGRGVDRLSGLDAMSRRTVGLTEGGPGRLCALSMARTDSLDTVARLAQPLSVTLFPVQTESCHGGNER